MSRSRSNALVQMRLASWAAVLFIVALALAVALPLLAERQEIRRLEEDRLHNLTQNLMLSVAQQLNVLHRSLDALRTDLAIWLQQPGGEAETRRRLDALGDAIPGLLAIRVIDASGQSWAEYNPEGFLQTTDASTASPTAVLWVQTPLDANAATPAAVRVGTPDSILSELKAGTIELLLDGEAFRLALQTSRHTQDTHLAVIGSSGAPLVVLPEGTAASSDTILQHLLGSLSKPPNEVDVQVAHADPPELDEPRLAAIGAVASELTSRDGELRVVASRDYDDLYEHWWRAVEVRISLLLIISVIITTAWILLRRKLDEQQRLEEKDFARQQLFAGIVDSTQEGILITDRSGRIVEANAAMSRISGYSRDELLGSNPSLFQSGRHGDDDFKQLWESLERTGHWYGELWNQRRDGSVYPALLTISSVRDGHGQIEHYAAIMNDITTLKENEAKLQRLAHHDQLTGLPNRRGFNSYLRRTLWDSSQAGNVLALLFIDLDGFKQINDLHGHEVGDRLLQALAVRLQSRLRQGDVIARLGGDEFIALLASRPTVSPESGFTEAAERLLLAASEPVDIDGLLLTVSASIGAVLYRATGTSPHPAAESRLLREADHAMYEAKAKGKNQVVFVELPDAPEPPAPAGTTV